MINAQLIYDRTDGGRTIIEAYYPQSKESFERPSKKFSIRPEKTPSTSVKNYNGIWFLTDFGESSKGKNAIDIVMQEEGKTFPEACELIAAKFGIGDVICEDVNTAKETVRPAQSKEKEGSRFFDFKPWTEAELRCMGPKVTKEHLEAMHWHSVKFITRVKNRMVTTRYSSENYFIFMRELVPAASSGGKGNNEDQPAYYKIYEPLSADKGNRFRYYPKLPENYINGLAELQEAYRALNKDIVAQNDEKGEHGKKDNNASDGWEDIERVKENKLKAVFICSGERDAMCVRSLGYQPIWFNSETHDISHEEMNTILKYAETVYNIPDIDETGITRGKLEALRFIKLRTIWLPMDLRKFKDSRGRGRKDFRDWMDLNQSNNAFKNLMELALPAQFWDVSIDKEGFKYNINLLHTLYFLWLNDYYILKDEDSDQSTFIHIDGNVVKKVTGKDIRAFLRDWAEKRALNTQLRNKILDNRKITDQNLEALKEIELDFSNADATRQLFFFKNCSVEVSRSGSKVFHRKEASELQHYVWEDRVIQHRFKQMEPFFSISWKIDKGKTVFDIEIKSYESKVLCYLINASRLYWKQEMEDRFGNNEEAMHNYQKANPFRIDGDSLNPLELQEQKTNLVNKLFALGYLFYNFKEASRPLAPFLMDYKIGDENQSNGGSGKSIMFVYVKNFINMLKLSGRDSKLMDNPHVFDQVTRNTDLVLLDDCYRGMQMARYYDYITSDLVVNPKNKQSFTIPFMESPKFAFTTNYVPNDFDPSSERRLLYVTFSDYYHVQTEENDYKQTRTVKDDFGKELFGYEYTEDEWNADMNLMVQCTQFFLTVRDDVYKINPPMHNIIMRKLKADIGDNFMEWAREKFADIEYNAYLDAVVKKQELFDNYRLYSNMNKMTAAAFKKKLYSFCKYCEWIEELNPADVCNTAPNRIIKKNEDGKSEEYLLIRSKRVAEQNRKEALERKSQERIEETDMFKQDDMETPF